jgi:hypothetical protein
MRTLQKSTRKIVERRRTSSRCGTPAVAQVFAEHPDDRPGDTQLCVMDRCVRGAGVIATTRLARCMLRRIPTLVREIHAAAERECLIDQHDLVMHAPEHAVCAIVEETHAKAFEPLLRQELTVAPVDRVEVPSHHLDVEARSRAD